MLRKTHDESDDPPLSSMSIIMNRRDFMIHVNKMQSLYEESSLIYDLQCSKFDEEHEDDSRHKHDNENEDVKEGEMRQVRKMKMEKKMVVKRNKLKKGMKKEVWMVNHGLLVDLQNLMKFICRRKGLSDIDEENVLTAFTSWLVEDMIIVPGKAVLSNRNLFIKTMKSAPKWGHFAYIIVQLSSIAASEAVAERDFSQLRYLNDPRWSRSLVDLVAARFRIATYLKPK